MPSEDDPVRKTDAGFTFSLGSYSLGSWSSTLLKEQKFDPGFIGGIQSNVAT
jgi:hypothetical protein